MALGAGRQPPRKGQRDKPGGQAIGFAVKAIDHVEVFVSDIAAAARWYEQALGLKEMARWEPEPVMIGAAPDRIGTSGTKLALFRRQGRLGKPTKELKITSGWRRVAWVVDRVGFDAAQKHLTALGIRFHGPQDHGLSQSIYFADPDGNPLEITFYL